MTKNRIDSKISDHTRYKKELTPPFLKFKMTPSSWIDERLPEMLWAVLVIGSVEREKALSFFRYISDYIPKNPDCYNVTQSGIGEFTKAKRKGFIVRASSWSEEVKMALRPLTLFPSLPAVDDWKDSLDKPIPKDDWQKLSEAILTSYWHQSQEATDCRWIRLFCVILGGKMKFTREMEDTVHGVFEYPNYGDMRRIRPFIRASEISLPPTSKEKSSEWSQNFWQYCYDKTGCIPEERVSEKIKNRQKTLSDEMEDTGKYYLKETVEVRNKLIDHFFNTSKVSTIDSRHEGAFGIALYGLTLFIEIILY
ncbi:MAG TPA: hypothetical protein G4N93_02625 [Dehalococcoidia bacterium]|nr:hypothetical protein [Dehalococcoidia bacterium]